MQNIDWLLNVKFFRRVKPSFIELKSSVSAY